MPAKAIHGCLWSWRSRRRSDGARRSSTSCPISCQRPGPTQPFCGWPATPQWRWAPLRRPPDTSRAPRLADRVTVIDADALSVSEPDLREKVLLSARPRPPTTRALWSPPGGPTVLVANLPYNVAVPVLLHLLAALPMLARGLVMVQAEVADRLCARPGSKVYGAPSAKLAWYAEARSAGTVPRTVFWPVPNVDSRLVAFARHDPPATSASREEVFAVIDAGFRQRRKTLRAALADWAGSAPEAERLLRAAGIDPGARGESLGVAEFARLAAARAAGTI